MLLAGGSGLIGRAISTALLAAGHQPVVLTRKTHPPNEAQAGVRIVTWNPPAGGAWESELIAAGAVINLAGASVGRWPWTAGRKAALLDSRLTPTRTLIDAIGRLPTASRPTVFVSASGTDFYVGSDAAPATEETPPADTFLSRLCVRWESEALRGERLGVRIVLMRTSSVIAPGAPVLQVLAFPFRLFLGGPIGSGQQWVSWVDLTDAVGLYLWALESGEIHGPLNVAAPDPRQQVDFARALGAAIGRPSWCSTPSWGVRLVLGEQATLALGSRRVWPAKALDHGYMFRRPRLEASLNHALGRGE